jgi:carboxymethylenebutenolidase
VSWANTDADISHGAHVDPAPQQKWAEEGYTVAHLRLCNSYTDLRVRDELREATDTLSGHEKCTSKSKYGIIGN